MLGASVPEEYLAGIRAAKDESGVEWGERDGEDIRLVL